MKNLASIEQNEKDLEEIREDIRNFATKNLDQVIPNRIRSSDFPARTSTSTARRSYNRNRDQKTKI